MKLPPITPNMSAGGAVYSDYIAKRIDRAQYLAENAVIVSDNLHWYSPKFYSPMPDSIQSYVQSRISGRMECSPSQAEVMGEWARAVYMQKDENDANLSLILWAEKILEPHKLEISIRKLRDMADRFSKLQFPFDLYERVMRVQMLDARDRKIAQKGS